MPEIIQTCLATCISGSCASMGVSTENVEYAGSGKLGGCYCQHLPEKIKRRRFVTEMQSYASNSIRRVLRS